PSTLTCDEQPPVQNKAAEIEKPSGEGQQQETSASESQESSEKLDKNIHKIDSPMVGTFYASPSPDADAYVSVGDKVKADSIVCIVEAMKLFNEIEADHEGEIVEVLAEDGQLVEYGQ